VAIIGYSDEPPLQAIYAVLGVAIVFIAARWWWSMAGMDPWERLRRGDIAGTRSRVAEELPAARL
jgi:hypothetical protein